MEPLKRRVNIFLLFCFGLGLLLIPLQSKAADLGGFLNDSPAYAKFQEYVHWSTNTPGGLANKALQIIFYLGILGLFIMMAMGGLLYISGSGNDEQTGKAKAMMLNAAIGYGIIIAAWVIVRQIISMLTGSSPT